MREIEYDRRVCDHCNYSQDTPQEDVDALAPGTELRNRFQLGMELGRGGFGITYVGYDKYLDCKVAIKEYYPKTLAARLPGEMQLFWRNSQTRDVGCQNVIREAQKMHRIGVLPAAVHVLDVFYENNTAYIAMDYVEGITLKKYLLTHGTLTPEKCMEMMLPILDTMILMHDAGIIHRDISPDNIMVQPDGKPRVLDFGAARDVQMESGYTILVARNGFSPKEQYQTNGNIGTWTDVYALCATMYYTLTGRVPPFAMDRDENADELSFPSSSQIPENLRLVLQDGMRMRAEKRIPTVPDLKRRLERCSNMDAPPDFGIMPTTAQGVITTQTAVPLREEKPKGFLPSIFSIFGKKHRKANPGVPNTADREPKSLIITQPEAFPVVQDSNATVFWDEEETVLEGAESAACVKGTLTQCSTGKRVEINKCCFVVGRFTSGPPSGQQPADLMIKDDTKHVSRQHAAILFDGEAFYLQDISGKNTTLLNGVRIPNGVMPESGGVFPSAYRLYHGDSIQLATEKLTFHTGGNV